MVALAAMSLLLFGIAGWIRLPRIRTDIASRAWIPERARRAVELSDAVFEPKH